MWAQAWPVLIALSLGPLAFRLPESRRKWLFPQNRPGLGRFLQGKVGRKGLALWRIWRRSGSISGRRSSLVDQKNNSLMVVVVLPLLMAPKIATWNINGLRDAKKRMSFIQWRHFVDCDVLYLLESYVPSKDECGAWFSSTGHDSVVLPGSIRSRGSVILFKNSISLKNHWVDSEGRLVLGEFDIRELSFRVCMRQIRSGRGTNFLSFVVISLIPVSTRLCTETSTR